MRMVKENQKIVRIIYSGDDGLRRAEFFANVDAVIWSEVDENCKPIGESHLVIDWYADHDENQARAHRTAGARGSDD